MNSKARTFAIAAPIGAVGGFLLTALTFTGISGSPVTPVEGTLTPLHFGLIAGVPCGLITGTLAAVIKVLKSLDAGDTSVHTAAHREGSGTTQNQHTASAKHESQN
ncbi:MAG: hypothetical protein ACK4XJ_03820 [Fimbriimonadaceae bacterium]